MLWSSKEPSNHDYWGCVPNALCCARPPTSASTPVKVRQMSRPRTGPDTLRTALWSSCPLHRPLTRILSNFCAVTPDSPPNVLGACAPLCPSSEPSHEASARRSSPIAGGETQARRVSSVTGRASAACSRTWDLPNMDTYGDASQRSAATWRCQPPVPDQAHHQ